MSDIHITPAVEADIPRLADIHVAAYASDLRTRFLFTSDVQHAEQITALCQSQIANPKSLVYKAIETSRGEIVGFAIWQLFDGSEGSAMHAVSEEGWLAEEGGEKKKGQRSLMEVILKRSREVQGEWLEGKKCMLLNTLVVDPSKQRRGYASALLRDGTQRADQEGVVSCLQSSAVGHSLYRNFGFRDVAASEVDLAEWGGKDCGWGIYRYEHMLRLPSPVDI